MDSILSYTKSDDEDFYSLLGCDESSSIEQILTEYRTLSLKYHPDKNQGDPNAVSRFQKLLKAKEILTDTDKRSIYDKWHRSGFAIPFEQFLNLNKACHTSCHWVNKKQKDLMLENTCNENEASCAKTNEPVSAEDSCKCKAWERDPANEVLRKFRNYEI
ncbi:J domain-containing protein [Araneus ventricosus]|uniref:J domain-containing protein n=1 Tax=Araneus ventricosus TaxID=182803 RepID=A0A4Y2DZZ1_ARAVE|nr:J domain-containing protein [Araneus ventricosus]